MLTRQWVYYIAAICSAALTIGTLGLKESRTSRSVKSKLASVIKKSTSEWYVCHLGRWRVGMPPD